MQLWTTQKKTCGNEELKRRCSLGEQKAWRPLWKEGRHHARGDGAKHKKHSCLGQVAVLALMALSAKPTCPAVMNGSCQDKPNKQICTVYDNTPVGAAVNNGTSLLAMEQKLHRSGWTRFLEEYNRCLFMHLEFWCFWRAEINKKKIKSYGFY